MVYKIKIPIRKVGGSIYALIPSGIVQELDLEGDGEVLAEFEKYRDVVKELCKKFERTQQEILLSWKDGREDLNGVIMFVNKGTIDFMSGGKVFVIPFNLIKEIKELNKESSDGQE